MKNNEEKVLALIDNLNTVKRFKHISVYLNKHNVENKFNIVAQKLDIISKVSDGWEWVASEPSMEMVDEIIDGMSYMRNENGKEGYNPLTLEYKRLRNKAVLLGASGNSPVASAAFKLGSGDYRLGIKKLKRLTSQT